MTGYRLYSDLGLKGDYFLIYDGFGNINRLFYTHTGLTTGLIYEYRVEVLNYNGPSEQSDVASRAACEVPSGFLNVYQISTSKTTIVVGWRYPIDDGGCVIQKYSVERDDGLGGSFTPLATSLSSSQYRYTISSGLTTGRNYRIKVSATNNVGTRVGNLVSIIAANVPDTPGTGPYREIGESTATSIRLKYDQVTETGGTTIISYHLQRTSDDGTGFFDVIGSAQNYSLSTSYTVTGLTTAQTYRFRYRAINRVGASGWSPVTYIQPATMPSTPKAPEYIESDDDMIKIQLFRSEEDGGLPILDYEVWMDRGTLTSEFDKLTNYNYFVHGFTYEVKKSEYSSTMTSGLSYRFKSRSKNIIGYSEYSDTSRMALGPLPSTPNAPTRTLTDNSATSIGLVWDALTGQTLEVLEYKLFMDDGNGVLYNLIYRGIDLNYVARNLTSGIAYSFKVSAVNFNGEG